MKANIVYFNHEHVGSSTCATRIQGLPVNTHEVLNKKNGSEQYQISSPKWMAVTGY